MKKKIIVLTSALMGTIFSQGSTVDVSKLNEENMFPFVPSYDAIENVVNVSYLLEAPAGKHGRIRVADGHFVNDKGRVRLNAVNLTAAANFPTHEEAERLASRLAAFGINCVRLHFFDSDYVPHVFPIPRELGIFTDDFRTKRNFDPERRDRQDYLIAQFKKRGIYVNFNLHVARNLDSRDGFAPGTPWGNKGVNLFDPRLIAEQKRYAKELLEHRNPYTGMRYIEDPVVAVVETNNEEAMWTEHLFRNMDNLGEPYLTIFRNLWNDWLLRKYSSTEKLQKAWNVENTGRIEKGEVPVVKTTETPPKAMVRDFYRFILETEREYWIEMRDYLKNELGVKALITGTQLAYSPPHSLAEFDYIDNHAYWCHPSVRKDWTSKNRAIICEADGACLMQLAGARVEGKPYTVSEYNHPYPNFYGAEGQPMLRAYGAFQGWDGVFHYSYNNRQNAEPENNEYFFSLAARSDVLAHFPACAAMFLRGDVRESKNHVVANLPYEKYFDRLCETKKALQGIDVSESKLPQALGLMHSVAVDVNCKAKDSDEKDFVIPQGTIESDTKELFWTPGKEGAHWIVKTANTKMFSGFVNGRIFDLGGVKLEISKTKLNWATVSLMSYDATGFGEKGKPARILLTATGLCHNGGAKFTSHGEDEISSREGDWGKGKTICEGISAKVTLQCAAARTTCYALDENGKRKAELKVASDQSGRAVVQIDPSFKTVWYEIEVR